MPGVLLIADASGEQLAATTAELVGEAVRLSAELGGPVTVLLAGKNVQGLAASLGGLGADRVLVADSQSGESFTLSARSDNARDVFTHPYAYAPLLAA